MPTHFLHLVRQFSSYGPAWEVERDFRGDAACLSAFCFARLEIIYWFPPLCYLELVDARTLAACSAQLKRWLLGEPTCCDDDDFTAGLIRGTHTDEDIETIVKPMLYSIAVNGHATNMCMEAELNSILSSGHSSRRSLTAEHIRASGSLSFLMNRFLAQGGKDGRLRDRGQLIRDGVPITSASISTMSICVRPWLGFPSSGDRTMCLVALVSSSSHWR